MNLIDPIGHDIDSIKPERYVAESWYKSILKNIFLILFFSAFVFISINFPAYLTIGQYRLNPQGFLIRDKPEIVSATNDKNNSNTEIAEYKPTIHYPDNSLIIPGLGIKAPVIWDVQGDNIMKQLENGVVHISGSSHVGGDGNIFLTGHSSNYWWKNGDYNTIFALLPELEEGAEIYLTNNGKLKKYLVRELRDVKKDEVDQYLNSDKEQLTLMTCVPVGTNLRRLLVFADPA